MVSYKIHSLFHRKHIKSDKSQHKQNQHKYLDCSIILSNSGFIDLQCSDYRLFYLTHSIAELVRPPTHLAAGVFPFSPKYRKQSLPTLALAPNKNHSKFTTIHSKLSLGITMNQIFITFIHTIPWSTDHGRILKLTQTRG